MIGKWNAATCVILNATGVPKTDMGFVTKNCLNHSANNMPIALACGKNETIDLLFSYTKENSIMLLNFIPLFLFCSITKKQT